MALTNSQPNEITSPNKLAHLTSDQNNDDLKSTKSLNPILQSSSSFHGDTHKEIRLSGRRWLVLVAFSIFGLTIALTDITSPILVIFLEMMDLNIKEYLYLQPIFYYIMMTLAFPTALFIDKFGIKRAMRTSAGLFVIHGLLRALLFYPDLKYHKNFKLPCYILSSIIGVEMMTIFFLLPLKVSESWFSSTERTVAWSFLMSQPSVGVCIASFVYPRIIRNTADLKILAQLYIGCVLVTAISTVAFVTRSEPKHPPNERIANANKATPTSFRESITKMLRHRDIVVHLVHSATFESLTLCIGFVIQPILKSIGYDEIFSGNLISLNSLVTIVMQISLAFFVNGMKNPTLTCKLGSFAQGFLFVIYVLTIIIPQPSWIIISASIISTTCKSWAAPNFTNMTAHLACGTVSQATVVGFSMFLTVLVMTVINLTFTKLIVISGKDTHSYKFSLIFLCVLSLINEIFYLGFFSGKPNAEPIEEDQQKAPVCTLNDKPPERG